MIASETITLILDLTEDLAERHGLLKDWLRSADIDIEDHDATIEAGAALIVALDDAARRAPTLWTPDGSVELARIQNVPEGLAATKSTLRTAVTAWADTPPPSGTDALVDVLARCSTSPAASNDVALLATAARTQAGPIRLDHETYLAYERSARMVPIDSLDRFAAAGPTL